MRSEAQLHMTRDIIAQSAFHAGRMSKDTVLVDHVEKGAEGFFNGNGGC